MTIKQFTAPGINCDHCTRTITMELEEMAGVSAVSATASDKQVTVTFDAPATWDSIKELMAEIDFPVQE